MESKQNELLSQVNSLKSELEANQRTEWQEKLTKIEKLIHDLIDGQQQFYQSLLDDYSTTLFETHDLATDTLKTSFFTSQ